MIILVHDLHPFNLFGRMNVTVLVYEQKMESGVPVIARLTAS